MFPREDGSYLASTQTTLERTREKHLWRLPRIAAAMHAFASQRTARLRRGVLESKTNDFIHEQTLLDRPPPSLFSFFFPDRGALYFGSIETANTQRETREDTSTRMRTN